MIYFVLSLICLYIVVTIEVISTYRFKMLVRQVLEANACDIKASLDRAIECTKLVKEMKITSRREESILNSFTSFSPKDMKQTKEDIKDLRQEIKKLNEKLQYTLSIDNGEEIEKKFRKLEEIHDKLRVYVEDLEKKNKDIYNGMFKDIHEKLEGFDCDTVSELQQTTDDLLKKVKKLKHRLNRAEEK